MTLVFALLLTAASVSATTPRVPARLAPAGQHAGATPQPTVRAPALKQAPRFGDAGVLIIGGSTAFALKQNYGTPNEFSFTLQPEISVFIVHHVLVGGTLSLRYLHALNTAQTTFALGPFAAYQFNIADGWDFLPTLGLNFGFQKVSSEMGGAFIGNTGAFMLAAKFIWTIAGGLQLFAAPYFTHTLYADPFIDSFGFPHLGSAQSGGYGLAFGLQGWL